MALRAPIVTFIDRRLHEIRGFLDLKRPTFAVVLFTLTLLFVVPIYNQGDLNHTVLSSYAYLKGHVFDFYDFNQSFMWGNDYLPLLYGIFALWMAPYFFLGLPVASEISGPVVLAPGDIAVLFPGEILWAKLLLVIFFVISVFLVYKIAKLIHPENLSRQSVAVWSYSLSPFALFSFAVFSQYDIIGIVFTLAAIYMFLQRKLLPFSVIIGFALSFKFFAALLVVPLLFLATKNVGKIILYGVISLAPVAAQFMLYWSNEAFRDRIFTQVTSKAGGAATSWEAYLAIAVYLLVCFLAIFSERWRGTFEQKTILVALASYGFLLASVVWHPQWVLILTPFIALMNSFMRRPYLWLIWESLAFIAFIGFVVTFFQGNVDGVMIERGVLGSHFPPSPIPISSFYPSDWIPVLQQITELFFISGFLVLLFRTFVKQQEMLNVPSIIWFGRGLIIWVSLLLPSFLAIYMPSVL